VAKYELHGVSNNVLSDVGNQHPPVSGGCQEQVAYANNTRPFLGAGTYTASDNALRLKAVLPRETTDVYIMQ